MKPYNPLPELDDDLICAAMRQGYRVNDLGKFVNLDGYYGLVSEVVEKGNQGVVIYIPLTNTSDLRR